MSDKAAATWHPNTGPQFVHAFPQDDGTEATHAETTWREQAERAWESARAARDRENDAVAAWRMTQAFAAQMAVERDEALAERDALAAQVEDLTTNPRDVYHTMSEIYEYRMLYNAHAAVGWLAAGIPVVKSRRHSDGEECFGGGWFIVTADLPTGQVSNHYRDEHWLLFEVPEVDLAPEWDGHTPAIAADRLSAALGGAR